MPRKCCVKGCKSNSRNHAYVSSFSFPKDVELRQKWIDCIPRKRNNFKLITGNTVVCNKHFLSSDIITENHFDVDGRTLIVPRKITSLRKGAVPSVFNNLPSDDSKQKTTKLKDLFPPGPFFLETVWDNDSTNNSDSKQPATPSKNPYVRLETLKLKSVEKQNKSSPILIADPVKEETKDDLDNDFLLITDLMKNGSVIQNDEECDYLLHSDPTASDPIKQEIKEYLDSTSSLDIDLVKTEEENYVKTENFDEIGNYDETANSEIDNKSDVALLNDNGLTTESNEQENENCKYCKQKIDANIVCETPPKLFTNVDELLTCLKYNDIPSDFISLQRDKSVCFIIYDNTFSPTVLASAVIDEDLHLFLFMNSVQLKRLGDHDFPRKVSHINALKCILNLLKVKVL